MTLIHHIWTRGLKAYRQQPTFPATRGYCDCANWEHAPGHRMPGVTTITDQMDKSGPLMYWAVNQALDNLRKRRGSLLMEAHLQEAKQMPARVRDAAADWGTQAHDAISRYFVTREQALKLGEYGVAVSAAERWAEEQGLALDMHERAVLHPELRYAGTFDAMGDHGPAGHHRLAIVDWKTGKSLYAEMAIQVAAYAKAYEAQHGVTVNEAWVVRLPKQAPTGKQKPFEARRVADLDGAFEVFEALLATWRFMKQQGGIWK
jgi:hypothetical protein